MWSSGVTCAKSLGRLLIICSFMVCMLVSYGSRSSVYSGCTGLCLRVSLKNWYVGKGVLLNRVLALLVCSSSVSNVDSLEGTESLSI